MQETCKAKSRGEFKVLLDSYDKLNRENLNLKIENEALHEVSIIIVRYFCPFVSE